MPNLTAQQMLAQLPVRMAVGGDVTDEQIRNYLAANAGASDTQLAQAMDQYGVTSSRLAAAGGYDPQEVARRYAAATSVPRSTGVSAPTVLATPVSTTQPPPVYATDLSSFSPSQKLYYNYLNKSPGQGTSETLVDYVKNLNDYQSLASLAANQGFKYKDGENYEGLDALTTHYGLPTVSVGQGKYYTSGSSKLNTPSAKDLLQAMPVRMVEGGDVTDEQIRNYFATNAGASDAQIAQDMNTYNITPARLAAATGYDQGEVARRYDAATSAFSPAGASTSTASTASNPSVFSSAGLADSVVSAPPVSAPVQSDGLKRVLATPGGTEAQYLKNISTYVLTQTNPFQALNDITAAGVSRADQVKALGQKYVDDYFTIDYNQGEKAPGLVATNFDSPLKKAWVARDPTGGQEALNARIRELAQQYKGNPEKLRELYMDYGASIADVQNAGVDPSVLLNFKELICPPGYSKNAAGVCELNPCPPGQTRNAAGVCVLKEKEKDPPYSSTTPYTPPTVYQSLPAPPSIYGAGQPALDVNFRNSAPRTWDPRYGYTYTPAAKLLPATGAGMSWTPPSVTSRPRDLLNIPLPIDTGKPYKDLTPEEKANLRLSSSQYYARDRAAAQLAALPVGGGRFTGMTAPTAQAVGAGGIAPTDLRLYSGQMAAPPPTSTGGVATSAPLRLDAYGQPLPFAEGGEIKKSEGTADPSARAMLNNLDSEAPVKRNLPKEAQDARRARIGQAPAVPQDYSGRDLTGELLNVASLATAPVPVLGDIAGLAADARMYQMHPEERTMGNYALSALGVLPFVPSVSAVKTAGKGVKTAAEELMALTAKAPTTDIQKLISQVNPSYMDDWTRNADLPEDVVANYWKLGDEQRGLPETAMVQAQRALGGGVVAASIEHIGDLTNRMTPKHSLGFAYESTLEKAKDSLASLKSKYGFRKEHEENLRKNAAFEKVPYEEYKAKTDAALLNYANAHRALAVYTPLQQLARDTSVALGEQRFEDAATLLDEFVTRIPTQEAFIKQMKVDPKNVESALANKGVKTAAEGLAKQGKNVIEITNPIGPWKTFQAQKDGQTVATVRKVGDQWLLTDRVGGSPFESGFLKNAKTNNKGFTNKGEAIAFIKSHYTGSDITKADGGLIQKYATGNEVSSTTADLLAQMKAIGDMPNTKTPDPAPTREQTESRNMLERLDAASAVEQEVYKMNGMEPGLDRASILPFAGSRKQGNLQFAAPQMLYDLAKAGVAPGVAASGRQVSNEDALNTALNITGGSFGASHFVGPAVEAGETMLGMAVKNEGNLNLTPIARAEVLKGPEVQTVENFLNQLRGKPGMTQNGLDDLAKQYAGVERNTRMTKAEFEKLIPPSQYNKVDLGGSAEDANAHLEELAQDVVARDRSLIYRNVLNRLGVNETGENARLLGDYYFRELDIDDLPPEVQQALTQSGMDTSYETGRDALQDLINEAQDDAVNAAYEDLQMNTPDDVLQSGEYAYRGYQRLLQNPDYSTAGYFELGVTHPEQIPFPYKHYPTHQGKESLIGHVRGTLIPAGAGVDARAVKGMNGEEYVGNLAKPNSMVIEEIQSDAQKGEAQSGVLRQVHGTMFKAAIQHALENGVDTVYLPTAKVIGDVRGKPASAYASIYDQQIVKEGLNPLLKIPGVESKMLGGYHEITFTPEAKDFILKGEGQAAPGYAKGGPITKKAKGGNVERVYNDRKYI